MFRKGLFLAIVTVSVLLMSAAGLTDGYNPPQVGECLQYKVYIKSMMHGADQTVRVVESSNYKERPVLRIQSNMDTVGLAKTITKYREWEEIILDLEGLYPWVIRRQVSDKDGLESEEVAFDYANGLAVRTVSKNGGAKEQTAIQVPGYVQDVLSLQFYLRKNIALGNNQIYFYSDGEIRKISYQGTENQELLTLECGEFKKHYQINNAEQKITILLSATPERYPLVIRKIGKIGKIEAKLVGIK
ncbi:MAG: DUF3108 domain-containing protein [Bacteroidota bacterium]